MWQSKNFHTNNCRSCKKQSSDALTVYSLLICGLLFLISTGCAQERGLEAQSPRYVVEKTITEGPVSLDFKVSRDEITVVGKVELVLAAILPEGYEVEFPEPESGPKRLMVAHSHKTDPELTENSMVRPMLAPKICVLPNIHQTGRNFGQKYGAQQAMITRAHVLLMHMEMFLLLVMPVVTLMDRQLLARKIYA